MSPAPRDSQDAPLTRALGPAAQSTSLPGDVSVADLVRELQETNRLLRALVSHQAVELKPLEALPTVPSPAAVSGGANLSPSTPELQAIKAQARQLVESLAHAAFDPADREHLKLFREETIQLVTKTPESPGHDRRDGGKIYPHSQVRVVLRLQDQLDHKVDPPSELLWNWRTHYAERNPHLTDHEMEQLRRQWPVYFDLNRSTQSIARDSGWILGNNPRRSGVLCASPLVVGPDRDLVPASTILAPSQADALAVSRLSSSNLVSPGSLW